ncbi:type III secretion system cytoplasmic ring protein SctQ [Halomonas sp. SpR8]|uniref:type III secretion system cytoplasmic ring protein SctQ n=1 Tax=Halomonas sp. SpR8 TaxID=3050463 RepID=UPI0027E43FF9|nr:type III secretion system cytoplasmic ring protein SctQ [Halomonas sp. SpR8]MDQ7729756.1 type III secretion system cytoplasmic ring protein SctQ [Halomonas sp. SpR8]
MMSGEAFLNSKKTLEEAIPDKLISPRLPRLPTDTVTILNVMSRPRVPLAMSLGGTPLRWLLDPGAPPGVGTITIGIVLGEEPARLTLDSAALAMLVAPLSLRRSLQDCTPEVRALWLEYALLEWLEPLEARLGSTIRFNSHVVDKPGDLPVRLALRLESEEQRGWLSLSLSPSSALALHPLLDAHCPVAPKACSAVVWPLQWVAGCQTITLAELRGLNLGDVVMLDRPGPETAEIGGTLMAEVAAHRDGMQLRSPFHVLTRGDFNMAHPPDEAHKDAGGTPQAHLDETALDRLPVRLVCEFGRLELSLGELRELDQGSVLPLSRPSEEAVDLVVNGKAMGRGRLVEVGDGLGVQIVRLVIDE